MPQLQFVKFKSFSSVDVSPIVRGAHVCTACDLEKAKGRRAPSGAPATEIRPVRIFIKTPHPFCRRKIDVKLTTLGGDGSDKCHKFTNFSRI